MKKCLSFAILSLVSFLAGNSYGHFTSKGHVHTLSETNQVFWNPDCRSTDTCDLKRFTLTTSVYETWFSDDPNHPTYSNGAIIEYETDAVDALEKYAVVQFLKGCVFLTSKTEAGRIHRHVSETLRSFGENIPLCFPQWVIDSQDTDPAYNSDPEYGRFYLLRWNEPGSYDNRTEKFYGAEKPKNPIVYMADYPSGAFVSETAVRNAALEFKTCIYKASEVPARTWRDNANFAEPITCFEWQNVYVYDFDSGRFQTDLAAVPKWEEPSMRIDVSLLVMLATLLMAISFIAFSRLGRLLGQKDRSLSVYIEDVVS